VSRYNRSLHGTVPGCDTSTLAESEEPVLYSQHTCGQPDIFYSQALRLKMSRTNTRFNVAHGRCAASCTRLSAYASACQGLFTVRSSSDSLYQSTRTWRRKKLRVSRSANIRACSAQPDQDYRLSNKEMRCSISSRNRWNTIRELSNLLLRLSV
jgi:hypothetical protein